MHVVEPRRDASPTDLDDAEGTNPALSPLALSQHGPYARMLDRLAAFGAVDHTVVFQGERGSGKTALAELLHARSARARRRFEYLSLASLDDDLASSELFGHVAGAFTGAKQHRAGMIVTANGGTVLLDEIGKASLRIQQKLLDVIERRCVRPVGSDRNIPVNVRLIFAANEPLNELVADGRFLADLNDRFGLFRIRVPSLRERVHDIPDLVDALLMQSTTIAGRAPRVPPRPSAALLRHLQRYPWPGNVRELKDLLARLVADARGAVLLDEDLLVDDLAVYRTGGSRRVQRRAMPDRGAIQRALEATGGNRKKAAENLEIGRTTLYRLYGAGNGRAEDGPNSSVS